MAVKLGLVDKLPKLDTSSGVLNKASQTARLLDEWEQHTSSKIGEDRQVFHFRFNDFNHVHYLNPKFVL